MILMQFLPLNIILKIKKKTTHTIWMINEEA